MQTPISTAAVQAVQPLVDHGLREIQAGGTVQHALREVALAGWLVGRGQTPQNAIRIVEQSEYGGVDGLQRGEPTYEPGYRNMGMMPGMGAMGGMPGMGMMPGMPGMGTGMMPGMPGMGGVPGVGAPGGMPGMGVMPPGMPAMPSLPLMPGMTTTPGMGAMGGMPGVGMMPGMGAQMMPYGKGMGKQY